MEIKPKIFFRGRSRMGNKAEESIKDYAIKRAVGAFIKTIRPLFKSKNYEEGNYENCP